MDFTPGQLPFPCAPQARPAGRRSGGATRPDGRRRGPVAAAVQRAAGAGRVHCVPERHVSRKQQPRKSPSLRTQQPGQVRRLRQSFRIPGRSGSNELQTVRSVAGDQRCPTHRQRRRRRQGTTIKTITAIDLGENIEKLAGRYKERKDIDIRRGNALSLDFYGKKFDVIYSFGVFHHTSDPIKCISEAHRVLKKNGTIAVATLAATKKSRATKTRRLRRG